MCNKGNALRSYLEVRAALLSTNKLARRTLSGQTETWMKAATWSQLAQCSPSDSFFSSVYSSIHISFCLYLD